MDLRTTAAPLALAGGAALAASLCVYASSSSSSSSSVPRPPRVGEYPIIGSLLHLKEPWPVDLYERFGQHSVVTVRYGLQDVHVLNQWPAFKEAMVDNAERLSGRVSQRGTAQIFGDIGGIVSSDGELWRQYRRFTLKTLRDFGFGRRGGEDLIVAEAEHLCRSIDAADGAPIETSALLSGATSNVICQLVFGSRVAAEDPSFADILSLFRDITQSDFGNVSTAAFLTASKAAERWPLLMRPLCWLPGVRNIFEDFRRLLWYCDQHRLRHQAEMADEKVHRARDYIEAHLLHQQQSPEIFNDRRLVLAVADLFIAGTDTTSHTLRWSLLLMLANPATAEKVRAEIREVVGDERLPRMADRQAMPFTCATIEEVLRVSCLVPLGVFHRCVEEVQVGEYQLEKDAICSFNVFAIHHDPRLFPEPRRFRPERHLDADGRFVACEQLASFGLGKRACLGESLARMELFVFFTAVMQRYTFGLEAGESRSPTDLIEIPDRGGSATIRAPPQHRVEFVRR